MKEWKEESANGRMQPVDLSVIIPCYNVETTLIDKCINSILRQDYENYEIIFVNDGSDECYEEYFQELSHIDSRIHVMKQKNQGVSVARNNGVAKARGKYITFIDADDVVVPYFFSESMEIANKEDADIVVGANCSTDNVEIDVDRKISPDYKVLENERVREFVPHLLGNLYRVGHKGAFVGRGPVARLVKSEIAKETYFERELSYGEDGIWNLEIIKKCKKLCIVHQIWYLYYVNASSATRKYNPELIKQCEAYLEKIPQYIDMTNDQEYLGYIDRIFDVLWITVYEWYLCLEQVKSNREERKQSIRYLYSNDTWKKVTEDRYYRLTSPKKKIKSKMFKYHLLFAFWDMKHNI
jgi:glycosyltransferase involved in cell wall biosynthesis